MLCGASEYDELPVRHNEDVLNSQLAQQVCSHTQLTQQALLLDACHSKTAQPRLGTACSACVTAAAAVCTAGQRVRPHADNERGVCCAVNSSCVHRSKPVCNPALSLLRQNWSLSLAAYAVCGAQRPLLPTEVAHRQPGLSGPSCMCLLR